MRKTSPSSSRRPYVPGVLFVLVLLPILLAVSPPAAFGKLIENREQNFVMEIPPGWSELPRTEAWEKLGLYVGAIRELD